MASSARAKCGHLNSSLTADGVQGGCTLSTSEATSFPRDDIYHRVMRRDWVAWHGPYDEPGSSLRRRLELVQRRIRTALDSAPPGPIQVISMCAGQGRDLLEVLASHPRRHDVAARLVELDQRNVAYARERASWSGLDNIDVVEGDASLTSSYAGATPADLVLVCGVFGNISLDDIRTTIEQLPRLCREGGTVIWTRHRRPPDATIPIRAWFADAGFEEVGFDTEEGFLFGVGAAKLTAESLPFLNDARLFDFIGDGSAANL